MSESALFPELSPEEEVLSGSIERVVFHSEDSGFSVLRVRARGHRDIETVVGRVGSIRPGEWIKAAGRWVKDPSHGLQFQAAYISVSEPDSAEGLQKYLASGAIPGIGQVYAKKLVNAFGAKVFDVIENQRERLTEVPGIGPVRADRIIRAWEAQKPVREIMLFLRSHRIGAARAAKIHKLYGADALRIMSENPYRLARDIRGIGFAVADGIATAVGIRKDAPVRVRAGISHTLAEATKEGHCALPRDGLMARARELLDVRSEVVEEALAHEIESGSVVPDEIDSKACVFLPHLQRAERNIAEALAKLIGGRAPWPRIDAVRALPWAEGRMGLVLAPSQAAAVQMALRSKVMVMTGGPGVGKTTIVNAILTILATKRIAIELAASTGRAAKRLSEATKMDARTIHRLLEFDPVQGGFRRNRKTPLDCDLLVIDEASMVDLSLMDAVLKALPRKAGLLLVGDVDQLPSVGPGHVLADLIASEVVPVAKLVEVFRQAAESRIVVNAHRVNRGEMPETAKPEGRTDFYFVPADSPEIAIRRTIEMVRDRIPRRFGFDPVRDIQVLCPMNRGAIGTKVLNAELQAALNPGVVERMERHGWVFCQGDKVMQTENDYDKEVYNGDIGFVVHLDVEKGRIEVDFDGQRVVYSQSELDSLVPAYATTIHKSQGSEYPAVVIPIMNSHFVMLQRNLIYTGITRGKRLVVLLGQPSAIRRAVQTASSSQRYSKLRERIRETARDAGPGPVPGLIEEEASAASRPPAAADRART